jgi:glycerol uptake facilitator-like aquaporin
LNPFISFSFFLVYKLKLKELLIYLTAQITGSFIAGILCSIIFNTNIHYAYPVFNSYLINGSDINAFYAILFIEFIGSFLLGALYSFGFKKSIIRNRLRGFYIGFAVFSFTVIFYSMDGAVLNILRIFPVAILSLKSENILPYVISIFTGTFAGFLFSYQLTKNRS